jgi:fibronectin type 3 domain-containing protein
MATTNTLTWNKNPEPDVAKYNVYRSVGAAPTKVAANLHASVPSTVLTYVDTVTVDGDYFYGLTAVDTANNESLLSATVHKVVDLVPPTPPTGLVVV